MPTVFVTGPQGDVSPGVSPVGIFGSSGKSDWAAFPQLFGLAKVNPVEWHRKPQISIEICRWRNDLIGVSAAEMKSGMHCRAYQRNVACMSVGAALPLRRCTLTSQCQALGRSEHGAFASNRVADLAPGDCHRSSWLITCRVPGNNMAFRRSELLEVLREEESGLIEGPIYLYRQRAVRSRASPVRW